MNTNFIKRYFADVTIGASFKLDGSEATQSIKSIKQELREAQNEAVRVGEKFGLASKEAAAAAMRVAELRDKVDETNNLVQAFNPDTKFVAFGNALKTVASGFAGAQGAMALFGVEGKDIEKTLLKVQAAMALSEGIAGVQEGIKNFRSLSTVIQQTTVFQKLNNAATQAAAAVQRLFAGSVEMTSTSFKVLKGAIAATGIGLLIVGIGELVNLFNDLGESAKKAAEEEEKAIAAQAEFVNQSLSSETRRLEQERQLAVARAKIAGESEQAIFDINQRFDRIKVQALKRSLEDMVVEGKVNVEAMKALREELAATENKIELDRLNRQATVAEQGREQAKKDAQARLEQAKKDRAEEARIAAGGITGKLTIGRPMTDEEMKVEANIAARKKDLEDRQANFQVAVSQEMEYTWEQGRMARERQAQLEVEYENRKVLLESTGNLLGAFSELVGRQTAAGKVLAIAQATINTYVGATEVLRAKSTLPEPIGTISKIINVAAIIATGVSAIKNIVKTQVPGGAGGGGGNIGSVSAPVAAQSPVAQTTKLDSDSLNKIGQASTRAFVLESDITNNQERIRRINRAARLG